MSPTQPCPVCAREVRSLYASAHALLLHWDAWQFHPSAEQAEVFAHYVRDLRLALAGVHPLIEAHFADRRHALDLGQ